MSWSEDIRGRFPDWGTDAAIARWPEVRVLLHIGQQVRGSVIARAPFGIWLDIGVSQAALLLVTEMCGLWSSGSFEDYPPIGEIVDARIVSLGERGEIALSQHTQEGN